MKPSKPLILLLLLLLSAAVFPQYKTFEWDDVLCRFKGTYDPAKVSLATIEETKKLIDFGMGLPLQTDKTAWSPEDTGKLDVDALDKEYAETLKMLEELKPADTEFFRDLKRKHIETLKRSYELGRVTIKAYADPTVLRDYQESQQACFTNWGLPLIAGGDALLSAWRTLHEEQLKRNGAPDMLNARFNERYASEQRDAWARVEIMNFGWWNCVNRTIPYVENDGSAEEQFKKLFVKVETLECDEP